VFLCCLFDFILFILCSKTLFEKDLKKENKRKEKKGRSPWRQAEAQPTPAAQLLRGPTLPAARLLLSLTGGRARPSLSDALAPLVSASPLPRVRASHQQQAESNPGSRDFLAFLREPTPI
jgi:hypothetical protein